MKLGEIVVGQDYAVAPLERQATVLEVGVRRRVFDNTGRRDSEVVDGVLVEFAIGYVRTVPCRYVLRPWERAS
jgi:hypothetical protein